MFRVWGTNLPMIPPHKGAGFVVKFVKLPGDPALHLNPKP